MYRPAGAVEGMRQIWYQLLFAAVPVSVKLAAVGLKS